MSLPVVGLGAVWALGLACASGEAPSAAPLGPPLVVEEARLEAPGLVLLAATASVEGDGLAQASQVRATVLPPAQASDRPSLTVEAPDSTWDLKARAVRFSGGVTVTRAEVVLTCDELLVQYAGADRIESALATGRVQVRQGERRASGDSALLTTADGSIVLTGTPRISEGPNELSGQRITLYLDDERVRCEGCRLVVDGQAVSPR